MIEAVIFDLDGTLLNTLDDLAASVNYMLGKYGLPQQETSAVRRNLGNGARYLLSHLMPQGTDTPDFDRILVEYGEYYKEHCMELTAPFPGIMDMLRKLKQEGMKVHHIAACAWNGMEKAWEAEWRNRYTKILMSSDKIVYVSARPGRAAFFARNHWMVDHSSRLIGVYTGAPGGTKETIEYARQNGIEVITIKK